MFSLYVTRMLQLTFLFSCEYLEKTEDNKNRVHLIDPDGNL